MRKRYITINKKLPILIAVIMVFSLAAKEKGEDTNIICFAAKNKWICAPEDQQEIANKKAEKLIEQESSEQHTSEVVIKSINMPKFNSSTPEFNDTVYENQQLTTRQEQSQSLDKDKPVNQAATSILEAQHVQAPQVKKPLQTVTSINPYAKLWSHQLIGLSTPQSAVNFIKNKKLNRDDVLVIQSTRSGMDWWIVLYGLYKDKATGMANEVNLPNNLDKPWLRPLRNLEVKGFIEKY